MKSNLSPELQFESVKIRFYSYFKWKYLNGIEKAADKQYASRYFFNTLFVKNPLIPRYSVYYFLLVSSYTHHSKLGNPKAVSITLDAIPEFNAITSKHLETALLHSARYEGLEHVHWLYIEAIEDCDISMLEVLDAERRMLKADSSRIVVLLALQSALLDLRTEFDLGHHEEDEYESEPLRKPKLTRSQQVLIAYYISQALGIKHQKNVSKCTDALHSFLNITYSQITNSELYKKMLNPLSFSSEKSTLQNLSIVREFFENWGAKQVLELIDHDFDRIKKQLDEQ